MTVKSFQKGFDTSDFSVWKLQILQKSKVGDIVQTKLITQFCLINLSHMSTVLQYV